jgi:excisionase family DNA binding protein
MNENEQVHEIMTLKEVAAYFRCSERHMQNLIGRGLPHFRLGSLIRFRKEDVMQFLASNQKLSRRRLIFEGQ